VFRRETGRRSPAAAAYNRGSVLRKAGMSKIRGGVRLALAALAGLCGPAVAEPARDALPMPSCPALRGAMLFYAFVPSALGAKTWVERELEKIRLGARAEANEDLGPDMSYVLLALHGQSADEYALEGPPEPAPAKHAVRDDLRVAAFGDAQIRAAFDAMGISPESLMDPPEVPYLAVTFSEFVFGLYDWGLQQALSLRQLVRGIAPPRVDPEPPDRELDYVRYEKPKPKTEEEKPRPIVLTKRVLRSVYKVLLGLTIGILIWGFVRNTG
jgi:hypothetical protein